MAPVTGPAPGAALRYPAAWLATPNPHGPEAARAAEATLRAAGVLASARAERGFAAAAPALLGACPFPRAGAPALRLVTTFLANWALYDDTIERTGEPDVPRAAAALRGDLAPADLPPFLSAFAAVGAGLRGRSPAWRDRFGARFADTTRSVDTERALLADQALHGAPPTVAAYLAWRRVNIGVLPVLSLVEVDLDAELAPVLLEDPLLAALEDAASDVVLAINDLHGEHRDAGGLNLAASLAWHDRLGPAAARTAILALHDDAVARVRVLGDALLARHPDDSLLPAWIARVGHVLAGFAEWHARAPRYGHPQAPDRTPTRKRHVSATNARNRVPSTTSTIP